MTKNSFFSQNCLKFRLTGFFRCLCKNAFYIRIIQFVYILFPSQRNLKQVINDIKKTYEILNGEGFLFDESFR